MKPLILIPYLRLRELKDRLPHVAIPFMPSPT